MLLNSECILTRCAVVISWPGTSVEVVTVLFVRSVCAIPVSITDQAGRDAVTGVSTAKEARSAR